MKLVHEEILNTLLESYQAFFNITRYDEEEMPLTAICEFYERSERFVLSRKAELWAANCEEFIFLFDVGELTYETYKKCEAYALNKGMEMAHIGPGHMYTYITPIFLCDNCDKEAKKAIKRCRIYKSFKFSLHGWMDFHVAVYEIQQHKIYTNRSGKCVEKILKKVFIKKRGSI